MYTLVIDTATERAIAALFYNDLLVEEEKFAPGLQSSGLLLPAIANLLQHQNLSVSDLKLIVVGVGPGSYTGIRVGVAAAKALSFPNKIPLVGVCSLATMSPEVDGPYLALIDARVSGAYILSGERKEGNLINQSEPALTTFSQIAKQITPNVTIVAPTISRVQERLIEAGPLPSVSWLAAGPLAKHLLSKGRKLFDAGAYTKNAEVEILYLRKTQAEIEREQGTI